jgi:hypothetical protein
MDISRINKVSITILADALEQMKANVGRFGISPQDDVNIRRYAIVAAEMTSRAFAADEVNNGVRP